MEILGNIESSIKNDSRLPKYVEKIFKELWDCPKLQKLSKTKQQKDDKLKILDRSKFMSIAEDLIKYFLSVDKNDLPEGIFRTSPTDGATNVVKKNLLVYPLKTLLKKEDICMKTLASALKHYLRESEIFSNIFKNVLLQYLRVGFQYKENDWEKKLKIAMRLTNLSLPTKNRDIFHSLINMIKHILTSSKTQMSINGMATIFSTCIFPPDIPDKEEYLKSAALMEGFLQCDFVECQFSPKKISLIHKSLNDEKTILDKLKSFKSFKKVGDRKSNIKNDLYGNAIRRTRMTSKLRDLYE